MRQEIFDYLDTQRVGVLAVEMPDGSPHAATVHFAHTRDPLAFFFETYQETRKAQALLGREKIRASFVVGSNESDMKTLQLDGEVHLLAPSDKDIFRVVYLGKFPEKVEKSKDSKVVFFKFRPAWWRFTDWKNPQGKLILSSHQ